MTTTTRAYSKHMTDAQANELARVTGKNPDELRGLADEFEAHSIIVSYMSKPMLSDESVKELVLERLQKED